MQSDLLMQRLSLLNEEDLVSIGVGGLRIAASRLRGLQQADLAVLCSAEIRAAAGSSLRNLPRGSHEFSYKQLLIDVADKLSPGLTPLSWTKFRVRDEHRELEIEQRILDLFEEQARRWWDKLSDDRRQQFVDGINSVLRAEQSVSDPVKKGPTPFLQQQVIEQLIQSGLIVGLARISAGGLLGAVGISVVGQLGWIILLQAVGWMAGLKIAVFGIGGYGAAGGAVAWLGTAAIGSAVALPGMIALIDGPAYRKTVPTTIMILAKSRINELTGDHDRADV